MKLWKNAKFYTLKNSDDFVTQIITNNGLIYLLGDECYGVVVDEVIDLNNAFVFPGFIDSHMHLIGYGRKLVSKNVNDLNFSETLEYIGKTLSNYKSLYEGYVEIGITKDDLDKVSNENIIILRHNDYHSFTVNSKTLELINLKHKTGILTKDSETNLVLDLWNNYNKNELTNMTQKAIESLHENGITSVFSDDLSYFNSFTETNEILMDVASKYNINIYELIHYKEYDNYLNSFNDSNYLKPIQVKTFYDGTLSSKTALLKENYKNTTTNGLRSITKNELIELTKKVRLNNDSLAIHVIGDLALEEVIDVLEQNPSYNLPDRIIHASLTNLESIERLSHLNITIDIQPLFKVSDSKIIESNINHNPLVYPFKLMNDFHLLINSSSDAPVEDINPLKTLAVLNEFDRFDAIKTYTVNPGKSIKENIGLLKKGYKANLTIFNSDIMDNVKNELFKTKTLYTVVNEQIVYKNEEV